MLTGRASLQHLPRRVITWRAHHPSARMLRSTPSHENTLRARQASVLASAPVVASRRRNICLFEAESRHRAGVMGRPGPRVDEPDRWRLCMDETLNRVARCLEEEGVTYCVVLNAN
jgi:hypothetical protein